VPKKRHLITTVQASEILRVDRRTVHRLSARGHLPPALKIAGRTGALLFDEADVQALAAQRRGRAA
jgi:predicted DNA-binding transcriptional regulator AlpA